MRKFGFLTIAGIAIILSGCTNNSCTGDACTLDNNNPSEETQAVTENGFFGNRSNSATWAVAMQKPSINDMENWDAIINGYTGTWTKDYALTQEDVKILNSCLSYDWPKPLNEVRIEGGREHSFYYKNIGIDEIIEGNVITLTGDYKFDDSKLQLTDEEKSILSERGWNIVPIDRYENFYKLDYSEDSANNPISYGTRIEEWGKVYEKIGGHTEEFERNPANTVLITNDLLLHSFHKLFDNTLKYYEQTISRDTIKDLSQELFDRFANLAKSESDPDLKETYEFLAAYWSVPAILLLDREKMEITPHFDEEKGERMQGTTNSDDELKNMIRENSKEYLDKLNTYDKELISDILEKIFKANETMPDNFLMAYSPDFVIINNIQQDYTQFVPRSHYTDNAELKTYFMAMKWLMREKFYFGDDKLVNAALVMVNNITDEDTQRLSQLSTKIKKLIGGDDDLTLESLSNWMKENNINTIDAIKNITDEQKSELFKLVPQKIQSTAYSTDEAMSISSDDAKDMTAGFVFFGEKFTLDSYIFDLMTAGSAEEESRIMPNKQSALIVPDILENNSDAAELIDLWMNARIVKGDIDEDSVYTQYSSYNKVKQDAIEKIRKELNETTILDTVYHKRIDMLGYLINETEENAPYFKLDPIYKLKNLVTYMGSYTELKHDTLLYVKQSYAEMGGGDGGSCYIVVDPEALPVPKGYIEADIDVINQLIQLNNETKNDFSELKDYVTAQFTEFDTFLTRVKSILEQQMKNEEISDEDFEWIRTAYEKLYAITFPQGDNVSEKEMRGALIADIFTSEGGNPLYEAVGRPALMLVMVDDINGKRIAIGPVFTHYEFYDSDGVINSKGSRLNDIQWQANYDSLTGAKLKAALSTLSKNLNRRLASQE